MSLVGLIVVPPAMIVLRKLIRRVRAIVKTHFTGGTRTIETLQETLQGMRIVKAFTLEDEMRRRARRAASPTCSTRPTSGRASPTAPAR